MVEVLSRCRVQLFADDTLLYLVGDNIDKMAKIINEELAVLYGWLTKNGLSLNIEKTKFMIVKSRYNLIDTKNYTGVFVNGQQIEQVEKYKYLGVLIDEHLTFSHHSEYVMKKIAKKINLLGRISEYLSKWSKLTIYKVIILPHLNYCSSILYLLNNTETNALQRKQNQAMRYIIKCNRYTSVKLMLQLTDILCVRQVIFLNTMTLIYKIKHGLCPKNLLKSTRRVTDVHNYQTRAREDFYVSTMPTAYSQNDLFHNGLIQYNLLPDMVKSSATLKTFKKRCTDYCKINIDVY